MKGEPEKPLYGGKEAGGQIPANRQASQGQ